MILKRVLGHASFLTYVVAKSSLSKLHAILTPRRPIVLTKY